VARKTLIQQYVQLKNKIRGLLKHLSFRRYSGAKRIKLLFPKDSEENPGTSSDQ